MSSSLNCQIAPSSNLLNEISNKNSITQLIQQQSPNNNQILYSPSPIIVQTNSTLNPIRKRKVKFSIKLAIEELLSVPYLNGVLFCKVRLCDGGHYVSYSSKKEVSNSSVVWANDSPIQFEVKTTQYYQYTTVVADNRSPLVQSEIKTSEIYSNSGSNNANNGKNNSIITSYEPCFCRISVRKELRGGRSYQKLGYVDCNLTDFIYKYQQENNQLNHIKNNSHQQIQSTNTTSSSDEFCVNRILKEYDTGSHISSKKNQQRLDNSYLKIKIKIIDNNQSGNTATLRHKSTNSTGTNNENNSNSNNNNELTDVNSEVENLLRVNNSKSSSVPSSPRQNKSISPSITFSSEDSNNFNRNLADQPASARVLFQSAPTNHQINQNSPEMFVKSQINQSPLVNSFINNFTPSHSRNSSSSTTNSTINPNTTSLTIQPTNAFINGHYRSCSNGSIKSNVSFDFLIKNRNKKLLEEVHSTSSSSQQYLHMIQPNQPNSPLASLQCPLQSSSPGDHTTTLLKNYSSPTKIEVASSNMQIIETRVDANEIINQIENELANRIMNNKKSSK